MLRFNNKETSKQFQLLLYKILNDVLFLWSIVFFGLLILEGLVPGYFSAYLSFTKMILAFFVIVLPLGYLGIRNGVFFPAGGREKLAQNKTAVLLLAVSFILIINSLRGFGILKAVIISVASSFIWILFYKILILDAE